MCSSCRRGLRAIFSSSDGTSCGGCNTGRGGRCAEGLTCGLPADFLRIASGLPRGDAFSDGPRRFADRGRRDDSGEFEREEGIARGLIQEQAANEFKKQLNRVTHTERNLRGVRLAWGGLGGRLRCGQKRSAMHAKDLTPSSDGGVTSMDTLCFFFHSHEAPIYSHEAPI